MNHESQNELLSAYLDGELTADQRAQVEHLLATKPAARKLLEELRTLSATLKSLPRQKVGEDLSDVVLRSAELRMRTEPADGEKTGTEASAETKHEEKQKIGTGASIEPVPVYSTILRRLKNPRMWVWEIVIVAVAVMLLVYYPSQNANRNVAPSGSAERNIAMANKAEGKPASQPQSSMRAAPSPATVEMKEALDVQIVRGKRPGRAGQSESPLAGKQPAAPDVSALAEKQPPAAAEPAAPTSTPAAGLAIQGQPQPGGSQIAKNINASKAPAEIKLDEPPVEKEPADRAKEKAASADELLVVRLRDHAGGLEESRL